MRARFAFRAPVVSTAAPDRLLELRVDVALPVLAKVDFRNRRTLLIRKASAENEAPIAGDVRGRRRS